MKAVFLVGGVGKRMLPITKEKALMKFCGKELILHQLDLAEKAGLKDFVIIASPLNIEDIKAVVGNRAEYAVQKQPKGMADAVLSAKKFFNGEVLIVNPNDLFDVEAYKAVLAKKGDAVVCGHKVSSYFPGGYFSVDEDKLKAIVEKPGEGNEPSDLVNIVVHLFRDSKKFIEYLETTTSTKDDVYEQALDRMVKDNIDVRVATYTGYWSAIKFAHDMLKAKDFFLAKRENKISDKANIHKTAVIENSCVEGGVKVFENAVVKDSYLGKGAIVGNNALVRESDVEAKSVVGFSTEICRSYIAENVWFHNNYVGDSVVMDNSMLGSGCITANLRFDEGLVRTEVQGKKLSTGMTKFGTIVGSNSKTGVNSTIYPGIKIGNNAFVGPAVVLTHDLPANKMIIVKSQELEVKDSKLAKRDKKQALLDKLTK